MTMQGEWIIIVCIIGASACFAFIVGVCFSELTGLYQPFDDGAGKVTDCPWPIADLKLPHRLAGITPTAAASMSDGGDSSGFDSAHNQVSSRFSVGGSERAS
jgi:hypothetical protein